MCKFMELVGVVTEIVKKTKVILVLCYQLDISEKKIQVAFDLSAFVCFYSFTQQPRNTIM